MVPKELKTYCCNIKKLFVFCNRFMDHARFLRLNVGGFMIVKELIHVYQPILAGYTVIHILQ